MSEQTPVSPIELFTVPKGAQVLLPYISGRGRHFQEEQNRMRGMGFVPDLVSESLANNLLAQKDREVVLDTAQKIAAGVFPVIMIALPGEVIFYPDPQYIGYPGKQVVVPDKTHTGGQRMIERAVQDEQHNHADGDMKKNNPKLFEITNEQKMEIMLKKMLAVLKNKQDAWQFDPTILYRATHPSKNEEKKTEAIKLLNIEIGMRDKYFCEGMALHKASHGGGLILGIPLWAELQAIQESRLEEK